MGTKCVLDDGGNQRLQAAVDRIDGSNVAVGWFANSTYPNGKPVAYIAAIQEFGYAPKNIPPRMGLRDMITKKQVEWTQVAEQLAKNVVEGGADPQSQLEILGGKVEGEIRRQIASVTEPPLKPATLAARARRRGTTERTSSGDKPLNDTGYMIASVSHVVDYKGGE